MKVTVKLDFLGLQPFEVQEREMVLELPEGAIFEDLAGLVEQRNPGFGRLAVGDAGGCGAAEFVVLLNGSNVFHSGGSRASLRDADVVHVIPAVAGG